MLTSAHKYTPRGLSLQTQYAATARALGTYGTVGIRHRLQTRSFHFGFWAASLDENPSHRCVRRRQIILEQRPDFLNTRMRRKSRLPTADDVLKRMTTDCKSYLKKTHPDADSEHTKETPDTQDALRSDQIMQGKERASDQIFDWNNDRIFDSFSRDSVSLSEHAQPKHNSPQRSGRQHCKMACETPWSRPVENVDYFIDPITSRKVPKRTQWSSEEDATDISVMTNGYWSQSSQPDDACKEPKKDLQKDDEKEVGVQSHDIGSYKYSQDLRKLKSETENALPFSADEATIDDLLRYKPFQDSELDANLTTSAEKLSVNSDARLDNSLAADQSHDNFDDLKPPSQFSAVDESNSLMADELASRFEDAETFDMALESRKANEEQTLELGNLGKQGDVEDLIFKYPNGITINEIQEEIRTFVQGGAKILIFPPVDFEIRMSIHEVCSHLNIRTKSIGTGYERRPTLRRNGGTVPLKQDVDQVLKFFSLRHQVLHPSESHGVWPRPREQYPRVFGYDTSEEITVDNIRAKYGQGYAEEGDLVLDPNAETQPTVQELNDQNDEIHTYCEPNNGPHGRGVESFSKLEVGCGDEFSEHAPSSSSEPDGKSRPTKDFTSQIPSTLPGRDTPCSFDQPDGQPPRSDMEAMVGDRSYEADKDETLFLEDERNQKVSPIEEVNGHLERQSDVRDEHELAVPDEHSSKCSAVEEEHSQLYTRDAPHETDYREPGNSPGLESESAHQELDAHLKHDQSASFAPKQDEDFELAHNRRHEMYTRDLELLERLTSAKEDLQKLVSGVEQGDGKQPEYWDKLESSAKQHEQMSDAHDEEATLAIKSAKEKNRRDGMSGHSLTGIYARDFPQEFERKWTQTSSAAPAEPETSHEADFLAEKENMDGGLEGTFGRPTPSKVQPALDRYNNDKAKVEQDDQYSQSQGLGMSSYDICGKETQPLLAKAYGTTSSADHDMCTAAEETTRTTHEEGPAAVDQPDSAVKETRSAADKEPVLYKILAYDPIMQEINIAQTSSMVPDFTSALSPADALLRLSNPTKFFPHFASLEAEGFEIASGSGDVLVFRHVRSPKPAQMQKSAPEDAKATLSARSTGGRVNPIDMTGRATVASPASANFASPTGYVKYENLPETEASNLPPPPPPPPPRVAYNINLRREEPVYSGPKFKSQQEPKQKTSVGKRILVGGVWFAGISYGLGVVSEYFTTGGLDGLGPPGI